MRVLIFEPTGGFWPYAPNISSAIANQEGVDEVYLLTSKVRENSQIADVILRADCRDMNADVTRRNPFQWVFGRVTSTLQWIYIRNKLVKELKPDVVHIQYTPTIIDQLFFPNLKGPYKKILTIHDVMPLSQTKIHTYGSLKKVYMAADELIVHSESNAIELEEKMHIHGDHVHVIPHLMDQQPTSKDLKSADDSKRHLNLEMGADYLLFFGSIRQSKGPQLAIEALAEVVKTRKNVKLLMAGSLNWDVDLDVIEARVKELNLEDHVVFHLGYVDDARVDDYFIASKIIMLPYIEFHSQSGVLLQAYSYETPVVVTNKGSLGETVKADQSGAVAVDTTPQAIAASINDLLSDEDSYEACIIHQRDAINKKYNSKNIGQMTVETYKK